jgi:hypothetical protein
MDQVFTDVNHAVHYNPGNREVTSGNPSQVQPTNENTEKDSHD